MNRSLAAAAGLLCAAAGAGLTALALRRTHANEIDILADRLVAGNAERDQLNKALATAESDYRVANARIRTLRRQLAGIDEISGGSISANTVPLSDADRAKLRGQFRAMFKPGEGVVDPATPEGGEQA